MNERYKLSKDEFDNHLIESETVRIDTSKSNNEPQNINCSEYTGALKLKLIDEEFYSFETCFQYCYKPVYGEEITNGEAMSNYFNNTMAPIAGYDYIEVNESYDLSGRFILRTLCGDFAECVHFCYIMFNRAKNMRILINNPEKSRFKWITELDHVKYFCDIIKVYRQILIARYPKRKNVCEDCVKRNGDLKFFEAILEKEIL